MEEIIVMGYVKLGESHDTIFKCVNISNNCKSRQVEKLILSLLN